MLENYIFLILVSPNRQRKTIILSYQFHWIHFHSPLYFLLNISSVCKKIRHVIYLLDMWVGSSPSKELVDNPIQGDATASWMI